MAVKEIKYIEPVVAGKVLALVGFVLGFVLAVINIIVNSIVQGIAVIGQFFSLLPMVNNVSALVVTPVTWLITGFIIGIVGAYIYNIVSAQIGGLKVKV